MSRWKPIKTTPKREQVRYRAEFKQYAPTQVGDFLEKTGLSFRLTIWDTFKQEHWGKAQYGYRLTRVEGGKQKVIFAGEDYHAIPSEGRNRVCAGIMTFLTLKKGDTDSEYFDGYSEEQTRFSEQDADWVLQESIRQFGEYT